MKAVIKKISGTAKLTKEGKTFFVRAMFIKGKDFVGAALLLKKAEGYPYVVLHLLCQGLEVLQKAFLLNHDFARFQPRLKTLGHDLIKGADKLASECGFPAIQDPLRAELASLNRYYMEHSMRYASPLDVFILPESIPCDLALEHCRILVEQGHKKFGTSRIIP